MAIKPVENESFYREVDEELRRDQMRTTWQRYRWAIIGGVLLLLAAIAGALWWQQEKQRRAGENAEVLAQVFQDVQAGRTKDVGPRLDKLIEDGSVGYRAAAMLTKADLALEQNKEAEAIAGFKAVAENADLPEPYRNLALIRQTSTEFDKLQPQAVIQRLQPLAQPGNSWFGSAGELLAVAHLKAGNQQEAARIFAAMSKDENVPESIRARAVQMAGALGIDAIDQAPATGAAKEAN